MSSENVVETANSENSSSAPAAEQIESDDFILAQELDTGYRILTEIIRQNKTACWPFMDEVDVKGLGLWDYHKKVKTPMWINKILKKFSTSEYKSITGFAKDFRTMVENCYRYNTTDHAISKKAKRLEMAFESKLALLKKELRDKTSLSLTSDGRFSLEMNNSESLVPVSRYGRIGSTREYASAMDDSSAKLVYDFVRCEETMFQEDEKKASYRERRQQEFLYQRIAAAWIATIEENPDVKAIKTCEILPEVGFFLHICESVLKLPELNMYQFERSLLVPKQSIYLSKIMTSLLCSYQERSQISQRPPMHFSTWNKRLKERFTKWFEFVQKYNSYFTAADKIGIDVTFFQSLNWRNPFVSDDKDSFSDFALEQKAHVLKALCDSLSSLQSVQNALYALDSAQLQCMKLGKDYLGNHYIYFPQFCGDDVRVYRHREYGMPVQVELPDEVWTPPKPDLPGEKEDNGAIVNGSDTLEEVIDVKNEDKPCSETVMETDAESKIKEDPQIDSKLSDKEASSPVKEAKDKDSTVSGDIDNPIDGENSSNSIEQMQELFGGRRTRRVRKQTARYTDSSAISPRKAVTRKQHLQEADSGSSSHKKKARSSQKKEQTKPKKDPLVRYGNVDFEMLCDSVDAIQLLINELESQNTKEMKSTYGRVAADNHQALIDKLRWLYEELEPWNIKLQKARLTAQIRMKKENDEIQNFGQKVDPWTEELNIRNTFAIGDNLTVSHANSPMSSVGSFDADDEEYVHPYYTRKSVAEPEVVHVEKQYDESLYEVQRQTLLDAALLELEDVLKVSLKGLMELADRAELQENNPTNDRRTRHKAKQQNKLLGKILQFAEENCTLLPSLLPILVPNSDVFDVVDMIYLEEETRLQEIADEQRRKRLEKQKRKFVKSGNENNTLESGIKKIKVYTKPNVMSSVKPNVQPIGIRMQNGRVLAATRLSDGRVIPIMRAENSSPATSVEQLIENTHKESVRASSNNVPTISLRPSQKFDPKGNALNTLKSASTPEPQTSTVNSPHSSSETVRIKSSSAVTVALPRQIIGQKSLQTQVQPNQSQPVVSTLSQANVLSMSQVVQPTSPMTSIILNGTRYSVVSPNRTVSVPQQVNDANMTSCQNAVYIGQPVVAQPVLTPVQIINPSIKYQPSVKHNKPSNVVLVPVQNCATTGIGPVRMGTTPVMGVLTSPQRQLQFQTEQKKS